MKKVILLTNILTPYRIYFFDLLHQEFKNKNVSFKVLVTAKTEPNRNWNYEDFSKEYTVLLDGKLLELPNNIFIHINFGLKKLLLREKPDLIVSAGTYLYPSLWNVLKLKKKLGYKVFYWSESHLFEERNYSRLKLIIREKIRKTIFKKFDGFWFAGKLSLQLIEKYAKKETYKIFVPNLIDNNFFKTSQFISDKEKLKTKSNYSLESDKIILLCPARITWVKGQLNFLELFLKSKYKQKFTILFVGDGDLTNKLEQISKNEDIKLLGYKSQNEILNLYAIADVFLLPSLSDPNPLTCIEALWCGLPLIVSKNVGNYPEVVKTGDNGYFFDYNDSDSLEKVLEEITLKDRAWFNKASLKSQQIAEDYYDSEKSVIRIVNENITTL